MEVLGNAGDPFVPWVEVFGASGILDSVVVAAAPAAVALPAAWYFTATPPSSQGPLGGAAPTASGCLVIPVGRSSSWCRTDASKILLSSNESI